MTSRTTDPTRSLRVILPTPRAFLGGEFGSPAYMLSDYVSQCIGQPAILTISRDYAKVLRRGGVSPAELTAHNINVDRSRRCPLRRWNARIDPLPRQA